MSERPTPETATQPTTAAEALVKQTRAMMYWHERALAAEQDFARTLRERDEARLALQNALHLFLSGCTTHADPALDDLEGCILCVRAERDEAREALRKADSLLQEVMYAHRNKDDAAYNECEKAGEECEWCAEAKAVSTLLARIDAKEST